MLEKKQLNEEELEQVSGGIRTVGNIQLYEPLDLIKMKIGGKVSIYSGKFGGNRFQYMCDGVITKLEAGWGFWRAYVNVSDNPSIKDAFFSVEGTDKAISKINDKDANCWFGPKQ